MGQSPQPTPVYLARRSYRQRRLRDAARVLPIAAAVLWILPLIAAAPRTSTTGLYLFWIWLVLIVLAAFIAGRLREEPEEPAVPSVQPGIDDH